MHNANNDKSWPHQQLHDDNESVEESSLVWESRSYQYNGSGKIQSIAYKYGIGAANRPGSYLYEASYDGIKQEYNRYSVKK